MTTNETLMPPFEATQFGNSSDAIGRKEQELSALLDRVLAAPFEPVLKTLSELSSKAKLSGDKLEDFANELSSVDENIKKVSRTVKTNAANLEVLDKALKEIAKAAHRSETTAAQRDNQLLEALDASRREAQQAASAAAMKARIMLILLAALLVALVGHLAFEVGGMRPEMSQSLCTRPSF
ncbi:hypothetical protein WBP06_18465 (plasmid) [Novosphingobium sp. BL-8H]|uniref:hypothetical protein n=1 Tax=Novosphingobium sp. BL-8H TaxID=3127640 RepID=UPI003757DB50